MRLQDAQKPKSSKAYRTGYGAWKRLVGSFLFAIEKRTCEEVKTKVTEGEETNDCLARKEDGYVLSSVAADSGDRAG